MTPAKDDNRKQWWESSHSEYVVDTTITDWLVREGHRTIFEKRTPDAGSKSLSRPKLDAH